MTLRTDIVLGLDVGTTSSKAVAHAVSRPGTPYVEQLTPWHTHACGQTEIDPYRLLDLAIDLIGRAVQAAEAAWGLVRVRGIGVTGLAESGVLLDAAGRPAAPVIAWFDHRGGNEIEQLGRTDPGFAARFARTTGLPWSSQASIAKLLWLRASGQPAGPGWTWLSVPEWIVFALGGDQVREPSLASRTGLLDQGTGQPWPDALAAAGLPARILPAERPAGAPAGYLDHAGVVAAAAGAVLTVAGHDHPVAAIGVGAVEADELFNSSGTADVLARSIPGTLDEAQRQAVVDAGWSLGRHVLPGTSLLLAGVSGGLLLRRVLGALGAESADARAALDQASLNVADLPAGLAVTGDGRTSDDVVIRLQDGATPASVWTAAVRYTADQARLLLSDIEKVVGPHRQAVAAGGWTRMASVRAAKAAAIDAMSFSAVVQPGVTGAALLAAFALDGEGESLASFIRQSTAGPWSAPDRLAEGMT
jgi:sugar (pentulose or hexulose) kinase